MSMVLRDPQFVWEGFMALGTLEPVCASRTRLSCLALETFALMKHILTPYFFYYYICCSRAAPPRVNNSSK